MSTPNKKKKKEVEFSEAELIRRVTGFAQGAIPFKERTLKLPPPVKEIPAPEIKRIRAALGYNQSQFAILLNVPTVTAKSWEIGKRRPSGAALRLLDVARHNPQALFA